MTTEISVNLKDRQVIVRSVDDVEAVLEHNKKLRALEQKSDCWRHVASIPPIICVKWLTEAWNRGQDVRFLSAEWDLLVAQKLRDPDYAYLRTNGPVFNTGWRAK